MRRICASLCVATAILVLAAACNPASGAIVTFSGLPGSNGTPFTTPYTEGNFTVTPTSGSWFEAHVFGDPLPSIFGGPIFSPSTSSIGIGENTTGYFTFAGLRVSTNTSGPSTYLIQGLLSGSPVLTESGSIPFIGAVFQTISSVDPLQLLDDLSIQITPGGGATSFNLDNIEVTTRDRPVPNPGVPEPSTLVIWSLLGALPIAVARWRRKRAA